MKRLESDTARRNENAKYLTSRLKGVPGIETIKLYDGVTRAAWHLYPFRYKKEQFNGAPLSKFLAALSREGIPCSSGYGPQYRDGLIDVMLQSKNFTRSFPKKRLKQYREELIYPGNDQVCEEAVWLSQTLLLGDKSDIDDIANAIIKVSDNRDKLA